MRNKIVAGNWKMNTSLEEAVNLLVDINQSLEEEKTIVCLPFTHILAAIEIVNENICVGAQNVSEYENGAYTGEISAAMLASIGVKYCIVGHSERRQHFNEADEVILKKVKQLLKNNITPIFCCGEPLDIRNKNQQDSYVFTQLESVLFHLTEEEIKKIIVAYEPIWAIGTGQTASDQQAQSMHQFIRKSISERHNEALANQLTIIYGGSVKPENAASLFAQNDIDGALVGRASLNSNSFTDIIQAL
jgi:triosephosphate isomerase